MKVISKRVSSTHQILKEFRTEEGDKFEIGQNILCDIFTKGEKVDVTGMTRGRGFKAPFKDGICRGPMSHGSGYHRGVGAMSGCASPAKSLREERCPTLWKRASDHKEPKWSRWTKTGICLLRRHSRAKNNFVIVKQSQKA